MNRNRHWKNALEKFLDINEELPEYKTKIGRVKIRKSLIGKLQGAHDSMTELWILQWQDLCAKRENGIRCSSSME